MLWGKRLQNTVAQGFAEDTGRKVELAAPYTIYVHDQYPMVGATPDAIETVPEKGNGALEIKVTDIEWEDEPPVFYQAQLQVQLSVLDFRFGTLAALHRGNRLIWADIMRHEEFIRSFLSKAEEFQWRLTHDRPPEVGADGSEDAGKAIAALYTKDTGDVVSRIEYRFLSIPALGGCQNKYGDQPLSCVILSLTLPMLFYSLRRLKRTSLFATFVC